VSILQPGRQGGVWAFRLRCSWTIARTPDRAAKRPFTSKDANATRGPDMKRRIIRRRSMSATKERIAVRLVMARGLAYG